MLSFNKEETKPFAETVLVKLCEIVDAISKNPSNPKFNYFTFEALSAIVRFVPGKDPAYLPQFEQRLTPLIMAILQKDIAEFTPYALQLLSQLLALNQEQGIPQTYQAMLPSFLQGAPWENHGKTKAT